MTSAGTPVAATASTVRSTSRTRVPPASARSHRLLDDRAVDQRVGVGQADLDDVGAGLGHRPGRRDRAVHGGEPGRQVPDEGRPALRRGPGEGRADGGHGLRRSAPRRQVPEPPRRRWRRPCPRARTGSPAAAHPGPVPARPAARPASACADSSAGMIPSVRHSSENASIAWASVIGPVAGPAGVVRARRAPGRPRGSPGPPRSSGWRASGRRRPAAPRSACRAARRPTRPTSVAACRPVSIPSPPASQPISRDGGVGQERVEDADRVGPAADAGDHRVGQPPGQARAPAGAPRRR